MKPESLAALLRLASDLAVRGAEAVVDACIELPLLLAMEDYPMPAFDVANLHVAAAINRMTASAA